MQEKSDGEKELNILGIETSSTWGSVAVAKAGRLVYSSYLDIRLTHSERLLPQIDEALKQTGIKISELDMIAISNGPGSFTGVRIGLAAAKGLCYADELPLYPVSTLKVLAANVYGNSLPILSFMDARMQEVYAGMYSPELEVILKDKNAKPEEILDLIDEPVTIVGDGYSKYKELIEASGLDYKLGLPHQNYPSAAALVSLVIKEEVDIKFDFEYVSGLEPWYLRVSQAEREKNKR